MLFNNKYLLACTKHLANINNIPHNSSHHPHFNILLSRNFNILHFPYLRALFKGYIYLLIKTANTNGE